MLVSAWEAIKDVSSVAAVILDQTGFQNLEKDFVWETNEKLLSIDLFWFAFLTTGFAFFLHFSYQCIAELINLCLYLDSQLSLLTFFELSQLEGSVREFLSMDSGDVIVYSQSLRVVSLATGWGSSDKYLNRVKTAVGVELFV